MGVLEALTVTAAVVTVGSFAFAFAFAAWRWRSARQGRKASLDEAAESLQGPAQLLKLFKLFLLHGSTSVSADELLKMLLSQRDRAVHRPQPFGPSRKGAPVEKRRGALPDHLQAFADEWQGVSDRAVSDVGGRRIVLEERASFEFHVWKWRLFKFLRRRFKRATRD